jgi:hypothetical protein
MGYEKLGSDQAQLAGFGGGVISEEGAVLLSGDSTGEQSLLFGSAALREIQAGVANGDFAIPPLDPLATIVQDGNPLPYWTFTDVNSAGAITAAIVADAGAASGNVLRFTVASGTLTGKSATLTRFIPVASSASRSFSFYAEATFESGTNSTQATATLSCEFYTSDQITPTGATFASDTFGFNSLQSAIGVTAPDLFAVAPDLTSTTAPANAAYLKLTITIATVATQSDTRTVDLTEVRVAHGLPELILTDKDDPATYQPAYIFNEQGNLSLVASTGENLVVGLNGYWLGSAGTTIESGGDINLIAEGDIIGTAANIDLTATTQVLINCDSATITAPNSLVIEDGVGGGQLYLGDAKLYNTSGDTVRTDSVFIVGSRITPATSSVDRPGFYFSAASGFLWGDRAVSAAADATLFLSSGFLSGNLQMVRFFRKITSGGTALTATGHILVANNGTTAPSFAAGSDYRLKKDIRTAANEIDFWQIVNSLRPVLFTDKETGDANLLGFIAHEVQPLIPSAVEGDKDAVDENGHPKYQTLAAAKMIPYLVGAVQALTAKVNDLEARLAAIEAER